MKNIFKTLALLLAAITLSSTAFTAGAASTSASELVNTAVAKMKAAKSLTAAFTASGRPGDPHQGGTLTIAGNRFTIDSPAVKIWFDGKTQWTWSRDAGEVNITEPTPEELAQVNPYAILTSLKSRYKASFLGNPSQRTVLLTPAMPKPEVSRAEVTFGSDGFPSRMKLFFTSGNTMTVTISSVKTGGNLPDTTFRFVPSKAPGAEIVDLR